MENFSIGNVFLIKLLTTEDYRRFSKINSSWLTFEEQESYSYLQTFIKKYKKFPTLASFLQDNNLPEIDALESVEYYEDAFIKRHTATLLSDSLPVINKLLSKGKSEEVIKVLSKVVEQATSSKLKIEESILTHKDLLNLSLDTSLENRIKELRGITTGWKTLDKITGGFTDGNLFVVVARTKLGKSAILSCMAKAAFERQYSPMFVSLEMPTLEVADRFLGLQFHVNKKNITSGRLSSALEVDLKSRIDTMPKQTNNFYFIEGKFNKTIKDISFLARELKPDIVYIDGAYLLKTDGIFKSKWEKVSYITEEIKYLAMEMDIPIVASYQFNRSVSRQSSSVAKQGFESIALSDVISQLSSMGLAILSDSEDDTSRILEVFGAREGGTCNFKINWDWESMDFSELGY